MNRSGSHRFLIFVIDEPHFFCGVFLIKIICLYLFQTLEKMANLTIKHNGKTYKYAAIVKTKEGADNYIRRNSGTNILGWKISYKAKKIDGGYAIYMHTKK